MSSSLAINIIHLWHFPIFILKCYSLFTKFLPPSSTQVVEETSLWSELQPEFLELILRRLVLSDYLKCRQVCRSWRSIVDDAKKTCRPVPQFPFLMRLPHPPRNRLDRPAIFLDITQNQMSMHTLPTHAWEGDFDLVRSEEGWLLFQNPSYYYMDMGMGNNNSYRQLCSLFWLFNPVSGEKCHLPPLPLTFPGKNFNPLAHCPSKASRATFSSASSSTADSQNFMVVVSSCARITHGRLIQQLSFCKVTNESWTPIETKGQMFQEIVLVGRKLYAMSRLALGFVTIFNLGNHNGVVTAETLVMLDPKPSRLFASPSMAIKNGLRCHTNREVCLMTVDSAGGEVLLVYCLLDADFKDVFHYSISMKGFRVFKVDMSGPRWIEIDSLGDRVILIDSFSEGTLQVISTSELNGPPEFTDCILFCVRNKLDPLLKCNLGVFFLKNKTIRPLPLIIPHLQASGPCLWFSPSP